MVDEIILDVLASKEEKYKSLIPQIQALIEPEEDLIANLSNVAAALHFGMGHFWTGFYLIKAESLVLGPFQGPIACTRIALNRGVCGKSWADERTIIVQDVNEFPGHIACSSASLSEIVVPLFDREKKIVGVMDVDSDKLASFDVIDQKYLEQVAQLLQSKF
ncbi:MAG: L-methionine (R)-S-oxide reductase [Flavobacteriales bacterium]|jgi:L-methionine (R)-S-oxide reductase